MNAYLRKSLTGAVAAAGLAATVLVTSAPASAQWRGHRHGGWGPGIAAGVVGGLALGALAAGAARPAYGYPAPVYVDPGYYPAPAPVYADEAYGYAPTCRRVWQPVYRSDGHYIRDRLVRVCR